jgi:ABC-type transport system involved in multi-copper enzyme maturation permease subunit
MKYLAILKDSVREAMDTWVFYVMAALSGLLILIVASISFRPLPVEDDVKQFTGNFNWIVNFAGQGKPMPQFDYADFEQTNPGAPPWQGDYRFTFAIKFPTEELARQFKSNPGFSARGVEEMLQQPDSFRYLDHLKVTKQPSDEMKELRYQVTSQGTKVENLRGWKHEPSLLFGALPLRFAHGPLGAQVYFIEDVLVNGFGAWIGILIGIVITAFFIPNMLRKGTVDLLLVKPIWRPTLLVFKYLGGLSFMFLNTALAVVGIWLVLGLRSGIWAPGFLLTIFVLTFFFAILYSVSALFGVLTRSPIVAILAAVVTWAILFAVGTAYGILDASRTPPKKKEVNPIEAIQNPKAMEEAKPPSEKRFVPDWVYTTMDVVHYVLPRTADLNALTSRLIIKGVLLDDNPRLVELEKTPFTWGESLTVSGAFIAVMLGLACVRFATKDY